MKKLVVLICVLVMAAANAQTCKDDVVAITPDSRFNDNGDGTVSDKQTGLIWMRCALGQIWDEDSATCTGEGVKYAWQNALQVAESYNFASSSAWRVPNLKELISIAETACYDQTINLAIFPNTYSAGYWTASSDALNGDDAWNVGFSDGIENDISKTKSFYVRLVRPSNN